LPVESDDEADYSSSEDEINVGMLLQDHDEMIRSNVFPHDNSQELKVGELYDETSFSEGKKKKRGSRAHRYSSGRLKRISKPPDEDETRLLENEQPSGQTEVELMVSLSKTNTHARKHIHVQTQT